MANPIAQIILSVVDRSKAAFTSFKGGLDSIGSSALGLKSALATIFAGLSVIKVAGDLKQLIDRMDQAGESAERIGTSTENFTALGYAAKLSASSTEELEAGLIKLSRSLDAAKSGSGPAAEAFRALRIDPAQFDDPSDALLALSERFAEMPNGVNKTALAMAIFGKTGANLIPLLNQGRDGIARLTDEARELGEVFDDDASGAAGKFNDNLDRLKASSAGLGIGLATKLMPSLNQYLGAMDDVIRKGSLFDKIAFFGAGFIGEETLNRITDAGDRVQDYNVKIFKLQQQLLDLRRVEGDDSPNVRIWEERIAALAKTREALIAAAKKTADASKTDASDRKAESVEFKKATDEQIKDAERLQSALQSAFSASLKAEEDYLRQAKKLRAEGTQRDVGTDPESQAAATLDATIAAMRLQREAGTANLETVQDQAEALRAMADQLEDVRLKEDLRRQANLAEASALERAAAEEKSRYQGLAEQQAESVRQANNLQAAMEGIGKEVSVQIVPGAGMDRTIKGLERVAHLVEYVKSLGPITVSTTGADAAEDKLRKAALQYGRRN